MDGMWVLEPDAFEPYWRSAQHSNYSILGIPLANADSTPIRAEWEIERGRRLAWATRGIIPDTLSSGEIEKILSPIDPEEFELSLTKDCKRRSDKLLDDFYAEYTNEE